MIICDRESDADGGIMYHLKCDCAVCGRVQDIWLSSEQYESYVYRGFSKSYPFLLAGWRDISDTCLLCPVCGG